MKILIVAPYCSLPHEPKIVRFEEIANLCCERGHHVTVITSKFKHGDKTFRKHSEVDGYSNPRYILIDELGYRKNFSWRRILSILAFQRNFRHFAKKRASEFDVIYSAFPLIGTNSIISKYKVKYNFRFIVDIQDIWPTSLINILRSKFFTSCISALFKPKLQYIFARADKIISVSETYASWVATYTSKSKLSVIPIGASIKDINERSVSLQPKERMSFFYVGSLSYIYDIETIIKAFKTLENDYLIELHIFGGNKSEINDLRRDLNAEHIFFHGNLEYDILTKRVQGMHIAINPLKAGASQSLTNKISDYLAWGHPILNSQDNWEVLRLLNNRRSTVHYEPENLNDCKAAIVRIYELNCHCVNYTPDKDFIRSSSYQKIVHAIEN